MTFRSHHYGKKTFLQTSFSKLLDATTAEPKNTVQCHHMFHIGFFRGCQEHVSIRSKFSVLLKKCVRRNFLARHASTTTSRGNPITHWRMAKSIYFWYMLRTTSIAVSTIQFLQPIRPPTLQWRRISSKVKMPRKGLLFGHFFVPLTQALAAGVIFSTLLSVNKYTFGNHSFVIERGIEEINQQGIKLRSWSPTLNPLFHVICKQEEEKAISDVVVDRFLFGIDFILSLLKVSKNHVSNQLRPLFQKVSPLFSPTSIPPYLLTEFRYL